MRHGAQAPFLFEHQQPMCYGAQASQPNHQQILGCLVPAGPVCHCLLLIVLRQCVVVAVQTLCPRMWLAAAVAIAFLHCSHWLQACMQQWFIVNGNCTMMHNAQPSSSLCYELQQRGAAHAFCRHPAVSCWTEAQTQLSELICWCTVIPRHD